MCNHTYPYQSLPTACPCSFRPKCLKPLLAASGPVAVAPLLQARPQKAHTVSTGFRSCWMACFQQARMPKTRPRSCRSRCRASSAGRKTPKRTGVQPYMSVYQSLPTACPCSFRPEPPLLEAKPQNAATHCYYRAPKLLDSFQQAQMPKTSPGSFRSRCRVSPPGAKLQKAATHCYRKLLDSH